MADPWEDDGIPDLPESGLSGLPPQLRLSCRAVRGEFNHAFSLGRLLAGIHGSGYRYTDLHTGNVGRLADMPGYFVLDPSGFHKAPLIARDMSGDFITPALSFTGPHLEAFIAGYVEEAYIAIESLSPGYTSEILLCLGCTNVISDPRPDVQPIEHAVEELLCISNALQTERHTGHDPTLDELFLAVSILVIGSHATPQEKTSLLRAIGANGLHSSVARDGWFGSLNVGNDIASVISDVLTELAPTGELEQDGTVSSFAKFRPRSWFAELLVKKLAGEGFDRERLRQLLIDASIVLAILSNQSSDYFTAPAIASLFTLAFALATNNSNGASPYERTHLTLWRISTKVAHNEEIDLERMRVFDVDDAAVAFGFYYHAAKS